jgi:uncharacterized protein YhhL (DUF1145 family)
MAAAPARVFIIYCSAHILLLMHEVDLTVLKSIVIINLPCEKSLLEFGCAQLKRKC